MRNHVNTGRPGDEPAGAASGCRHPGFAIIAALVLTALLSLLALEFSRRSSIGLRMSVNFAQAKKAHYYAMGGYRIALRVLLLDDNTYDGPGDPWYGRLPPIPFGEGSVQISVVDEQSRFNLQRLVTDYGVRDDRSAVMLGRLLDQLAIDSDLVDALVDWQDADELPLPGGGEASLYATGRRPYRPPNRRMLTVGESLLVRGMDRELLFAPPSARSPSADESLRSLSRYVTVYGNGRININTAELPVLLTLSRDLDRSVALDILDSRGQSPFESLDELRRLESVSDTLFDEIDSLITVKSDTFRIRAAGVFGDIVQTVEAVVSREGERIRVVYFNRSV